MLLTLQINDDDSMHQTMIFFCLERFSVFSEAQMVEKMLQKEGIYEPRLNRQKRNKKKTLITLQFCYIFPCPHSFLCNLASCLLLRLKRPKTENNILPADAHATGIDAVMVLVRIRSRSFD